MSAFIAAASKTVGRDVDVSNLTMEYMALPDFVTQNLEQNLIPYLWAIALEGYEPHKKPKLVIVGNTGRFKLDLKFYP